MKRDIFVFIFMILIVGAVILYFVGSFYDAGFGDRFVSLIPGIGNKDDNTASCVSYEGDLGRIEAPNADGRTVISIHPWGNEAEVSVQDGWEVGDINGLTPRSFDIFVIPPDSTPDDRMIIGVSTEACAHHYPTDITTTVSQQSIADAPGGYGALGWAICDYPVESFSTQHSPGYAVTLSSEEGSSITYYCLYNPLDMIEETSFSFNPDSPYVKEFVKIIASYRRP